MTRQEQWRSALVLALKCKNGNAEEISTAMLAIERKSPIAEKRVSRALCNAMAYGGGDKLTEDEQAILYDVIADLENPPGRLPDGDEAAGAHIHLRVTKERKAGYVRAAQAAGLNLSEWMVDACDRRAGN